MSFCEPLGTCLCNMSFCQPFEKCLCNMSFYQTFATCLCNISLCQHFRTCLCILEYIYVMCQLHIFVSSNPMCSFTSNTQIYVATIHDIPNKISHIKIINCVKITHNIAHNLHKLINCVRITHKLYRNYTQGCYIHLIQLNDKYT